MTVEELELREMRLPEFFREWQTTNYTMKIKWPKRIYVGLLSTRLCSAHPEIPRNVGNVYLEEIPRN